MSRPGRQLARPRLLMALLGLAVSVAAVLLIINFVDLPATLSVLQATQPLPILAALVVIASSLSLRAVRWSVLLRRPDGAGVGVLALFPPLLVGYLGNTVLPARVGEVIRAYLAARRERLEVSRVLGTVLLERVMDLASLAVVGALVAVVSQGPGWIVQGSLLMAGLGLLALFLLVVVGVGRVIGLVRRVASARTALVQRALSFLEVLGEGAGKQPRRALFAALAITFVCWLLEGTTFWLMGQAVAAPNLTWPAAMLIAAITVLGTAVPSAPGYVGTFELAAVAAAVALGVPAEAALAMALLTHLFTSGPVALAGALVVGRMSLSLRSLATAGEQQTQA